MTDTDGAAEAELSWAEPTQTQIDDDVEEDDNVVLDRELS